MTTFLPLLLITFICILVPSQIIGWNLAGSDQSAAAAGDGSLDLSRDLKEASDKSTSSSEESCTVDNSDSCSGGETVASHGATTEETQENRALMNLSSLNEDEFQRTISGHPLLLVAFTTEWCSACKRLQPQLEKAAQAIATDGELNDDQTKEGTKDQRMVAFVDCWTPNGRRICVTHSVTSYPVVKLFRSGKLNEVVKSKNIYKPDLTDRDLVGTLKREVESERLSRSFDSIASLVKFLVEESSKTTDGIIVGLFRSRRNDLLRHFFKTAYQLFGKPYKFVHLLFDQCTDCADKEMVAQLTKLFDPLPEEKMSPAGWPQVAIYRPEPIRTRWDTHELYKLPKRSTNPIRDEKVKEAKEENLNLKHWIRANVYGLLPVRNAQNAHDFDRPLIVIYCEVNIEDTKNRKHLLHTKNVIWRVAGLWPKIHWAMSDRDDFASELIAAQFPYDEKMRRENTTGWAVGYDERGQTYKMSEKMGFESLLRFAARFSDHELDPVLRSAPEPEYTKNWDPETGLSSERPLVIDVVSSTYKKFIVQSKRAVVFLLYRSSHPKNVLDDLTRELNRLADLLAEDDHIQVARCDVDTNQLPPPFNTVVTFPSVFLAFGEQRGLDRSEQVVQFDGPMLHERWITFVAHHGGKKLKNFSRDGEDPNEYKMGYKVKYEL